jgi:hypothetical protein
LNGSPYRAARDQQSPLSSPPLLYSITTVSSMSLYCSESLPFQSCNTCMFAWENPQRNRHPCHNKHDRIREEAFVRLRERYSELKHRYSIQPLSYFLSRDADLFNLRPSCLCWLSLLCFFDSRCDLISRSNLMEQVSDRFLYAPRNIVQDALCVMG